MRNVQKKNLLALRNYKTKLNCGLAPSYGQNEKCTGARTEMVGTPFLREVSTDLVLDSGSSFTLSFSLLSSTEESRWKPAREACRRHRTELRSDPRPLTSSAL